MLDRQVAKAVDGEGGGLRGLRRLEVEEGLEAAWERVGGEEGEERGLVGEGRVDDDDEGSGPAVEEMREEVQAVEARGEWRGGAYVVTMMPVMEKVSAL